MGKDALGCPARGRAWALEGRSGGGVIGELDGAPGPAFFPVRDCDAPELELVRTPRAIELRLGATRKRPRALR